MSDILIRGMEMPTRCGRCDMRIPVFDDGMFDHYECCITAAIIDNLGEKMEDCPLVPVQPHGRLIDADALIRGLAPTEDERHNGAALVLAVFLGLLNDAPTVIEAEEGEE